MSTNIKSPYGILILASAVIAAAVTIGTATSSMSPISPATADEGTSIDVNACEGQAWPRYSGDCLALMARQSDRKTPDRVLTFSSVSR